MHSLKKLNFYSFKAKFKELERKSDNKKNRRFTRIAPLSVLIFFILSSCIPQKKLLYLQDEGSNKTITGSFTNPRFQYKLKAGDEIQVKIIGLDDKTATLFSDKNTQSLNIQYNSQGGVLYYSSLTIDQNGNIPLPTIGYINLAGKNIFEARKVIQDSLNAYVNYGAVEVKLTNFRVSILGEVKAPGTFYVYDEEATIFDVLGMAGDLTPYGKRNDISVIRQTDQGHEIIKINLLDKNIMTSPVYYINPGDVIYVPNMTARAFGIANFQWGTLLSIISTTLSAISIIVYLGKK